MTRRFLQYSIFIVLVLLVSINVLNSLLKSICFKTTDDGIILTNVNCKFLAPKYCSRVSVTLSLKSTVSKIIGKIY